MASPQLVVIGTSMGGFTALADVLSALPKDFPWPVCVVQHRSKDSGDGLAEHVQSTCKLRVRDAEDKEQLAGGRVYLAPADYHLVVERGHCALTVDDPVLYARPSIDVLFESAARAYRDGVVAVVLTGASADGARGLATVKRRGGFAIVQDPATAERAEMPRAAMAATAPDRVLPLSGIAAYLAKL